VIAFLQLFLRDGGGFPLGLKLKGGVGSDSLVDDLLFLTPSRSKGFFKIKLTDGVTVYYRFESQFAFFYVVLSFDSQGAYSPRSLPILFYCHISMLDIWEKHGDDSE
jgi:hypothetical protein